MREFWKRKLPAFLLATVLLAGMTPGISATEIPDDPLPLTGEEGGGDVTPPAEHTHSYGDWTSLNESQHQRACTENDGSVETQDHVFGVWQYSSTGHSRSCSTCGKIVTEGHSFGPWKVTKPATATEAGMQVHSCTTAGCTYSETQEIPKLAHTINTQWEKDGTKHWHTCNIANERHDEALHALTLSYQSINSTQHQQYCAICRQTIATASHTDYNSDGKCDACGYSMSTGAVTVRFFSAGSAFGAVQTINRGAAPVNPGTPSRSASYFTYTFKGWTTDSSGNGGTYSGQSLVTPSSTPVYANTNYYAVYTITATNRSISLDVSNSDYYNGVSVGSTVRSNLQNQFAGVTGQTFVNVTFSSVSTNSYGVLYANSGQASLTNRTYTYSGGSYPVTELYFVPSGTRGTYTVSYFASDSFGNTMQGTLSIVSGESAGTTKITYSVRPGEEVEFDRDDFYDAFRTVYSDTVRWVTFSDVDSYSSSDGAFYYNYGRSSQREFTRGDMDDYAFYYNDSSQGSYPLDDLSFVAASGASSTTVSMDFCAYSSNSRYVDGTVEIRIGGGGSDITYEVEPGEELEFDDDDFYDFYRENASNYSLRYVTFAADSNFDSADGTLYYNYGGNSQRMFTRNNLPGYRFYYGSSSYGDYPLDDLSFVADDDFDEDLTLTFRAYYDADRYVDGKLVLKSAGLTGSGDIRYLTTTSTNVQINPNDIARFFNKTYSSYALQYVKLEGVPSGGTLYYNYYGVSPYGAASSLRLTSSNCDNQNFYFSPSNNNQYALSELTYVPSGANYCAAIPFTAYATSGRSVKGSILISVSSSAVPDVYGITRKDTSVSFPVSAIYNAVRSATSTGLSSIQLLELPPANVGTVYYGASNTSSGKANDSTRYTYSGSGSRQMNQLRFVPASNYTGSVEIPYVAYNSSDKAIASGKFCLGVLNTKKDFTDVNSSTWCYKYVEELSDAGVINGFVDGSFQPNKTVTYGQALKLIMLAADYPVQAPTGKHPFSGYLTKAAAAGLVSGVAEKNLNQPISRLAVAQIAAKAMRLDGANLSNVKPFTDTSDIYVQALNAAGIVEGYFSGGTSTFKPNGTMTRGQISAIVWRMDRAK